MSEFSQNSSGFGYGSMSLGEKINAAVDLTKRHGLTVFLTLLAGWLVIMVLMIVGFAIFGGLPMMMAAAGGSASVASGASIGAVLGIFLVYLAVIFLSYYFMIGVYSLLLKYVDGVSPEGGVIAEVLSPWHNFVPILLCLLVWFGIWLVCFIALFILMLIPFLGSLIAFVAMIFMTMVMVCVYFFIADKKSPNIGEAITVPFSLVKNNLVTWLVVMGVSIVVYIPGVIILGLFIALAGQSLAVILLGYLAYAVYMAAASIFVFMLLGITYRQTYGGDMGNIVEGVF